MIKSNFNKGFAISQDNVPTEKAIEIIMCIFDRLSEKYPKLYEGRERELIDDPSPMLKEFDDLVEIIKYGIYK